MDIVSRHPFMPPIIFPRFLELKAKVIRAILEKLSLPDFVRFRYGCSKATRAYTDSRVLEGMPFFLRESPHEPHPWFYAFSMQKWIQVHLPPAIKYWRPVSASGGLILFSGAGRPHDSLLFDPDFPLTVINILTHRGTFMSLGLDIPIDDAAGDTGHRDFYYDLHVGLKVNVETKTYKVVVHWKNSDLVQILDSGSKEWSIVSVPRELIAFADSSDEIIFCRSLVRLDENESTVFDLSQGKLVDCQSLALRTSVIASNNPNLLPHEHTIRGYPTLGESCLYAVDYNAVDPITFVRMYKKEKSQISWELVAEVPLNVLCYYLEVVEISNASLQQGQLVIHECGKNLLLSATYRKIWVGMLYDLSKQRWSRHDVVAENHGTFFNDGLFFQPQINLCPTGGSKIPTRYRFVECPVSTVHG